MAQMVWCISCKKVIWAYDHQKPGEFAGFVNMLGLKCPRCGKERTFDGWGAEEITPFLAAQGAYDMWSAMKITAGIYQVAWEPSPDNRWR